MVLMITVIICILVTRETIGAECCYSQKEISNNLLKITASNPTVMQMKFVGGAELIDHLYHILIAREILVGVQPNECRTRSRCQHVRAFQIQLVCFRFATCYLLSRIENAMQRMIILLNSDDKCKTFHQYLSCSCTS